MNKLKARAAIVLGVIYLLNPGGGIFEFIPDNFPVIGNLDEGAAMALVLWGWKKLKELPPVGKTPL
jgi:uncharacterized membrane protein YkvA (DUF1232 family)